MMSRLTRFTPHLGILLLLSGVFYACEGPPTEPPSSTSATLTTESPQPVVTLAKHIALALNNPDARQALNESFNNSEVKEGKILLTEESRIAYYVAETTQATRQELSTWLEQSFPIEMYLPVDEHRSSWNGGSDLLVAAAVDEDTDPVGFNIQGERRDLDLDQVPSTPTIVLTLAESFTSDGAVEPGARVSTKSNSGPGVNADPCLESQKYGSASSDPCSGGGGGGSSSGGDDGPDGLYMKANEIENLNEPWSSGDPELTFYAGARDADDDTLKEFACAGESKDYSRHINQDEKTWTGSVLLATESELDNAPDGEGVSPLVFEDDKDNCKLKIEGDPGVIEAMISLADDITNGIDAVMTDNLEGVVDAVESAHNHLQAIYQDDDDHVGQFVEKSCTAPSGSTYEWTLVWNEDSDDKNGCGTLHADTAGS